MYTVYQLWPVQLGNRLAAVPVGKGCQLLYSHHGVFTSESDEGHGSIAEEERKKEKERSNVGGVWDHTVLLYPNGQLMRFIVPFPSLVRYIIMCSSFLNALFITHPCDFTFVFNRMDDPSSHDAHILQKLPQAIRAGTHREGEEWGWGGGGH